MKWRVGFVAKAGDEAAWYHRFLHRYCHVWAARRIHRGIWFWIEWTHTGLVCGLIAPGAVRVASLRAGLVLCFDAPVGPLRRWPVPQLGTHCASVVAHALPLRVPLATPWRLSCALRRAGARPLLRPEQQESGR